MNICNDYDPLDPSANQYSSKVVSKSFCEKCKSNWEFLLKSIYEVAFKIFEFVCAITPYFIKKSWKVLKVGFFTISFKNLFNFGTTNKFVKKGKPKIDQQAINSIAEQVISLINSQSICIPNETNTLKAIIKHLGGKEYTSTDGKKIFGLELPN